MATGLERLQNESDEAYEAYVLYAKLKYESESGERTVREVARKCGKSGSLIGRWSSEHRWVERAAKYDEYLAQTIADAEIDAIKDMAKRHAEQGHYVASAAAQEFQRRWKAGELSKASLRDLLTAIRIGTEIEKEAYMLTQTNGTDEGGEVIITDGWR